jgi:hypothetical protein
MTVMAPSETVPAPLIALGREAVEAVASRGEMASFRGVALYNLNRDSIIQSLPSYEAARDAICAMQLVAERYGSRDVAGDRLTLQLVYQLFPRTSPRGVGEDVRESAELHR